MFTEMSFSKLQNIRGFIGFIWTGASFKYDVLQRIRNFSFGLEKAWKHLKMFSLLYTEEVVYVNVRKMHHEFENFNSSC